MKIFSSFNEMYRSMNQEKESTDDILASIKVLADQNPEAFKQLVDQIKRGDFSSEADKEMAEKFRKEFGL